MTQTEVKTTIAKGDTAAGAELGLILDKITDLGALIERPMLDASFDCRARIEVGSAVRVHLGALQQRVGELLAVVERHQSDMLAALLSSSGLKTEALIASAAATSPASAVAPAPAAEPAVKTSTWKTGFIPSKHPPKFRDPTTGATWSGRGPKPKWLKDLASNGHSEEEFRIGGAAPAPAPAPAPANEVTTKTAEVIPVGDEIKAPAAEVNASADDASFDATSISVGEPDVNDAGPDTDIGDMLPGLGGNEEGK